MQQAHSRLENLIQRTIGPGYAHRGGSGGRPLACTADASQLENAILNLAVNARDAMPEGGKLTIETSNSHIDEDYARQHADTVSGQYVLIAVTDTGCGMDKDAVAQAFEPFYTTKAPGRGTGLGLSQVYGFVKQSHGHAKIYSEVGRGTTLKLYLPRYLGDAPPVIMRTVSAAPVERSESGECVLVVDDEARVRHLSAETLRTLGYRVIEADRAAAALKHVEEDRTILLLFTDIVMPDMNGRKLADHALSLNPNLKVLYTTGFTRNAIIHQGALDPGVEFIAKPFTIEALARKVRQALNS